MVHVPPGAPLDGGPPDGLAKLPQDHRECLPECHVPLISDERSPHPARDAAVADADPEIGEPDGPSTPGGPNEPSRPNDQMRLGIIKPRENCT